MKVLQWIGRFWVRLMSLCFVLFILAFLGFSTRFGKAIEVGIWLAFGFLAELLIQKYLRPHDAFRRLFRCRNLWRVIAIVVIPFSTKFFLTGMLGWGKWAAAGSALGLLLRYFWSKRTKKETP